MQLRCSVLTKKCICRFIYLPRFIENVKISIAGPSFAVDSACSSGLLAIDHALRAIRTGQCDAAIVGGAHLCLNPSTTIQYTKFGMLSPYGACKTFDASRKQRLLMNFLTLINRRLIDTHRPRAAWFLLVYRLEDGYGKMK